VHERAENSLRRGIAGEFTRRLLTGPFHPTSRVEPPDALPAVAGQGTAELPRRTAVT
jgi:hypothetical protein